MYIFTVIQPRLRASKASSTSGASQRDVANMVDAGEHEIEHGCMRVDEF